MSTSTAYLLRFSWPLDSQTEKIRELTLFEGGAVFIGRHPDCDVRVVDAYASPKHAMIHISSDAPVITDLGSLNGLYIDGERIPGHWSVLCEGDKLTIGATVVTVERCRRPEASPAQPPAAKSPPDLTAIEKRIADDRGDVRFLLREHLEQAVADRAALFDEVQRLRSVCAANIEASYARSAPQPSTPAGREALLPERVIHAAHKDATLHNALLAWVRTGHVPVYCAPEWAPLLKGAHGPADLVGALAWALEEMIKSKASIMAAWQRDRETNGLPRRW